MGVLARSLVCWLAGLGIAGAQGPSGPQPPVQFVGQIADREGGGATLVTFHIDSFTTDEEVRRYFDVLQSDGMDGVVSLMLKAPGHGWIRIGEQLGYTVAIARSRPTEKGRLIAGLTDRPIQFFELRNEIRSRDYPMGMVILEVDNNGNGEGKIVPAAKARFGKDGRVELESYGTEPLKVIGVRTEALGPTDPH